VEAGIPSVTAHVLPPPARGAAIALAACATLLLSLWLTRPALFDNEGRYAEVAREMLVLDEWVTPHLDFSIFLNKPPLLYWLAALVFHVSGPSEWARLVPVLAAAVTILLTCRLGAALFGEAAGLVAGLLLATTLGFALEARTLRPDMLVMASVVATLFCWRQAREPGARTAWLVAMYAAIGIGILAKGLVSLVVVAIPIVAVALGGEGPRALLALRPLLGAAVVAAIVLPWHVAVARRNPGFAWDYVVNQHVLFFLDRKFPRDSEGDSLVFFWLAYLGRAFPTVVLAAATLGEAVRGARRRAGRAAEASWFCLAWLGGVLLFFSCAPSRLEHYSLPALPPTALLAARAWQRARDGVLAPAAWTAIAALGAGLALLGPLGLIFGADLVRRSYWIADAPGLVAMVVPAAVVVTAFGIALGVAAVGRRPGVLLAGMAAGAAALAVVVLVAEGRAERLFSWRPVAEALAGAQPAPHEVVFEAPEEYQIVGGLAFYARRRIALLEPAGFVPPTYLAGRTTTLFLPREEFLRRWQSAEPMALVSDSQRRRDDPEGLVPPPYHVLARFGDRWVLTNYPAAPAR
jgi:4-amino-4-deoxy-L-arabinose transferase-like glycosyltransferase